MEGHGETMLSHLGTAADEVAKSFGYRDVPIAIPDAPVAGGDPNGLIGSGVAGGQEALVVGLAIAPGLVASFTSLDGAESARCAYRGRSD
jgi:hypothetical protein